MSAALALASLGACGGRVIVDGLEGDGAGGAGGALPIPATATGVTGPTGNATAVSSSASAVSSSASAVSSSASTGTGAGGGSANIMIYSNYDGGPLNINVDSPLPNIVIGLVSYESMQVSLTGSFVKNVIAVEYAGYDSAPGKTSVTGVAPELVIIKKKPKVTLPELDAPSTMVCNYASSSEGQSDCNSGAQVRDYFVKHHGGAVVFHRCQYEVYPGVLNTGVGGTCP